MRADTAAGGWRRGAEGGGDLTKKQEGREREGEQGGRGSCYRWREVGKGKGDGWEGRREAGGGGYEVCTRLLAPGVPFGPGSGVREG